MYFIIIEFIGALWLITKIIRIIRAFRWLKVGDENIKKQYGLGLNSWALVTGATDGIGKEFVKAIYSFISM